MSMKKLWKTMKKSPRGLQKAVQKTLWDLFVRPKAALSHQKAWQMRPWEPWAIKVGSRECQLHPKSSKIDVLGVILTTFWESKVRPNLIRITQCFSDRSYLVFYRFSNPLCPWNCWFCIVFFEWSLRSRFRIPNLFVHRISSILDTKSEPKPLPGALKII